MPKTHLTTTRLPNAPRPCTHNEDFRRIQVSVEEFRRLLSDTPEVCCANCARRLAKFDAPFRISAPIRFRLSGDQDIALSAERIFVYPRYNHVAAPHRDVLVRRGRLFEALLSDVVNQITAQDTVVSGQVRDAVLSHGMLGDLAFQALLAQCVAHRDAADKDCIAPI